MDSTFPGLPRIRWMSSDDIQLVMAIEQDDVSGSWNQVRFEGELTHPASRYIVVDASSPVTGFGGLWLGVDEIHVVTMAVRVSERRNGLGALVLRGLLAVATDLEMTTATLECRVSNEAARSLYRKFGFVEVGERRAYYSDGEDAVIMTTEAFDSRSYRARLAALDTALQEQFPGVVFMPEGEASAARL